MSNHLCGKVAFSYVTTSGDQKVEVLVFKMSFHFLDVISRVKVTIHALSVSETIT